MNTMASKSCFNYLTSFTYDAIITFLSSISSNKMYFEKIPIDYINANFEIKEIEFINIDDKNLTHIVTDEIEHQIYIFGEGHFPGRYPLVVLGTSVSKSFLFVTVTLVFFFPPFVVLLKSLHNLFYASFV